MIRKICIILVLFQSIQLCGASEELPAKRGEKLRNGIYERLLLRRLTQLKVNYMRMGKKDRTEIENGVFVDQMSYWVFINKFGEPRNEAIEMRYGALNQLMLKSPHFIYLLENDDRYFNSPDDFRGVKYSVKLESGSRLEFAVTNQKDFKAMMRDFKNFVFSCEAKYRTRQ